MSASIRACRSASLSVMAIVISFMSASASCASEGYPDLAAAHSGQSAILIAPSCFLKIS
jgi:hypothetical protein